MLPTARHHDNVRCVGAIQFSARFAVGLRTVFQPPGKCLVMAPGYFHPPLEARSPVGEGSRTGVQREESGGQGESARSGDPPSGLCHAGEKMRRSEKLFFEIRGERFYCVHYV